MECSVCSVGKYAAKYGWRNSSRAESCTPCPAGTYGAAKGLTDKESCILCETNKYSSEGAQTCTACAEGQISSIGAAYCRTKPEELSEFFFELIGGEENLPIFFALVALAFVGFVVFLMVLSCMSKNKETKAEIAVCF